MNILYEINQTAVRFPDRTAMISGEERLNILIFLPRLFKGSVKMTGLRFLSTDIKAR